MNPLYRGFVLCHNTQVDKKIFIAGNPEYGLAKSLGKKFCAQFACRTNGFDLSERRFQENVADLTLRFDVFINCSSLYDFNQIKLLEIVYRKWKDCDHKGHILCIGSTADAFVKGTSWIYPVEKKALRAYCKNLAIASLGGPGNPPSGIRVTYVSPGSIDTPEENQKYPEVKKLDPDYISDVIAWIINQPESVNISEFALDAIQLYSVENKSHV